MLSKKPDHILVIRLSAMGDVAMTVPVIRAFTKQYPEVRLTVLTRPFFSPFFRDLKNVTILPIDLKAKHKGLWGLLMLSFAIRKLKIDAVADLHNVLRTKILKLFLIGIPFMQINKGRAEKKDLIKGTYFKPLPTTHQRYVEVFSKLGFTVDLANPTFPLRSELTSKIVAIIGKEPMKWIGVAPFAQHESKVYPLPLLEKVIADLSQTHKILLFGGGESEIKKLNALDSKFENVINLAGMLNLDEELDVISNLDLMISMDSGNAHMAAMLGVKVLTLWGVTHPYSGFYPFNQPMDFALLANRTVYPEIPTSVYGNKFPESYRDAMKTIKPEDIVEKVNHIL